MEPIQSQAEKPDPNNIPRDSERIEIDRTQYYLTIGASAGGLASIHKFLDNLQDTDQLSVIVIQHLSPDHKSLLAELLSGHTHMQVVEAAQHMSLKPNSVYVIPPGKQMTYYHGRLFLTDKTADDKGPNQAIDIFLKTLAKQVKNKAMAIILSGTGTDGTAGAKAIKDEGGMVIVETPETAAFDGMPKSAVNAQVADLILKPEDMPEAIYQYMQQLNLLSKDANPQEYINEIYQLVLSHTGCDFSHYKPGTVLRRIARRIRQLGLEYIEEYILLLKEQAFEVEHIYGQFLIGVTRFFRDEEAFQQLQERVIPGIVKAKTQHEGIKVWVTACSTGEEAYTIAIIFNEYMRKSGINRDLKIFATDIDQLAIAHAGKGIYDIAAIQNLPKDLAQRYFQVNGGRVTVNPTVRRQLVFAKHNLITDPPFIRNDLVTCRNLLIYFNEAQQSKTLDMLHYSLREGGYLLLGSSESASGLENKVDEIDRKWKIFKKKSHINGWKHSSNAIRQHVSSTLQVLPKAPEIDTRLPGNLVLDSLRELVLDDLGYAALQIDRSFEVIEAIGCFRKYLSIPEQSLSMNLMKMLSKETSALVGTAVRKALRDCAVVTLSDIHLNHNEKHQIVSVVIKPLLQTGNGHCLVMFREHERQDVPLTLESTTPEQRDTAYIRSIEDELKETRLTLQMTVESLEATNEELQHSNEELRSSNEELQSSNEELQSLNEELHTLNAEHQLKIAELSALNDDLNNYFSSTGVGQIFLDSQTNIRKFNPAALSFFPLIDSDIGRPIHHLAVNLLYPTLTNDITSSSDNKYNIEKEVVLPNGKSCLLRIQPYWRSDHRQDGVIISIVDISRTRELSDMITGMFNASRNVLMALKAQRNTDGTVCDFTWLAINESATSFYPQSKEELFQAGFRQIHTGEQGDTLFYGLVKALGSHTPISFEYSHCQGESGPRWYEVAAARMGDGVAVTFTDITEKKEAAERLQQHFTALLEAREELRALNTNLEQQVKQRTQALAESEQRFRLVSRATNDAIWDWDIVSNQLWVSENYYNMFGYETESGIISRREWLDRIHPKEKAKLLDSLYAAVNNGARQWVGEYRYQRQNATFATILDRGYILHDEYGTPYRMLSSMLDITQLRHAQHDAASSREQRLFLAESMPLIVWTASSVGKVNYINHQFCDFTGTSNRSAIGNGWEASIFPDDLIELRQLGRQSILAKEDFSKEIRLRNHDGSYRWFLLRAKARRQQDERVTMWVGTCTDIHRQKMTASEMEQRVAERTLELRNLNHKLEISNYDLQQFASVASHDLKEPLRKIMMFSQMLHDRFKHHWDSKEADYLDRILASASRMSRLIQDLLSYSRLSAEIQYEPVNLNTVIDEVLADLELLISDKKARIVQETLPIIDAIPGQIRQAFQNIISNALKFTRDNVQPEINISACYLNELRFNAPIDASGPYVRIKVSDNGIGFDEQYHDKIFTIFQRLHSRNEFEGTGIGLAIVKKIVDQHQGAISAQSKLGKGTTFIILLPKSHPNS